MTEISNQQRFMQLGAGGLALTCGAMAISDQMDKNKEIISNYSNGLTKLDSTTNKVIKNAHGDEFLKNTSKLAKSRNIKQLILMGIMALGVGVIFCANSKKAV